MQIETQQNGKSPEQIMKELEKFLFQLPAKVGGMAVRFFKDNITERQGFLNGGVQLWQRSRMERFKPDRDLLQQKGNLVRGITWTVSGTVVTVSVVGVASNYAEIQNAGGEVVVSKKMRKFFWAKYFEQLKKSHKLYIREDGNFKKLRSQNTIRKRNNDYSELNFWHTLALAKKIKVPARKFIGQSAELNAEIMEYIEANLDNIFNK